MWPPLARETAEPAGMITKRCRTRSPSNRPGFRRRGQPGRRNRIDKLLSACGFEVKIAHDGKTGISLARWFRPEVVLLDIGLPGMIGY